MSKVANAQEVGGTDAGRDSSVVVLELAFVLVGSSRGALARAAGGTMMSVRKPCEMCSSARLSDPAHEAYAAQYSAMGF